MKEHNDKSRNKFRLKPLAVAAIALCALVVIFSATIAWLTGTPINPVRLASIGDFKYQTNIYFLQSDNSKIYVVNDDGTKTVATSYTTDEGEQSYKSPTTGAVSVSMNSADPNYIGKLRVEIRQVGNGIAFTRVGISHEWLQTNSERLQGDLNLPYNLNDNFVDNSEDDGYLYYCNTINSRLRAFPISNGGPDDGYVNIITDFDASNFDASVVPDDVTLYVNVMVDAVQFNRYQQIWGMNSLPWLDA